MQSNQKNPTLQAIAVLRLLPHDIKNGIDQLRAFSVMSLCPVVAGATLSEDEVVGPKDLAVGPRSEAVHGPGLEIHEDGPRNEAPATCLVVVDIDSLELEVGVTLVAAGSVDAVLGADHLPELGPDLVAALAALDVEDLAHLDGVDRRS